ncbi:hypothetical protein MUK42_11776 [Musa troglodytarum]|uniref:Uncharacterized protein n=1 Tax=Musa troglodytarum TaxID=320322 RepID=A0A9E7GV25_9LILI|nr:hypothetical protein MUK42_11776 [Musa troglodytarum]
MISLRNSLSPSPQHFHHRLGRLRILRLRVSPRPQGDRERPSFPTSWIEPSLIGLPLPPFGRRRSRLAQKKPSLHGIKTLAEILESFDMVLLVRNDLEMGEGKIAARRRYSSS